MDDLGGTPISGNLCMLKPQLWVINHLLVGSCIPIADQCCTCPFVDPLKPVCFKTNCLAPKQLLEIYAKTVKTSDQIWLLLGLDILPILPAVGCIQCFDACRMLYSKFFSMLWLIMGFVLVSVHWSESKSPMLDSGSCLQFCGIYPI